MLKNIFALLVSFISIGVGFSQPEKKLANAFVQSVDKNNFQLLKPYLVTVNVAKTYFGLEFTKMSISKQKERIVKLNNELQKKWTKVVANAKQKKIDFNRLQLKQVLQTIIEENIFLNFLLVTYNYNNYEWDDLTLIVNKAGTAKYLIDIPSNTSIFLLDESKRGKNIQNLQQERDKKDPKIKEQLIAAVQNIKDLIATNKFSQIYSYIAYTGREDMQNRWKRTVDPAKPGDTDEADRFIEKLKATFTICDKPVYGKFRIEKESEGVWYVITTICGTKKIEMAFLKINDAFVLGDID